MLAGFGVATLLLGALYLASQRDLKRLLAYSSVEHMGMLAIGMSFASPLAIAGVLLHVLAHAAAKGTAFFGAGSVVRKLRTKDLERVKGGIGLLPWSGPMFVAAMFGLSAMPPFGTFRSEFYIVVGGLAPGTHGAERALAAVLVVLVTLAFLGLSWHVTQVMASPGPQDGSSASKGETSKLMVVAMSVALLALVVLGVHPPPELDDAYPRRCDRARGDPMTTASPSSRSPATVRVEPHDFAQAVAARTGTAAPGQTGGPVGASGRFAGLFGSARDDGSVLLARRRRTLWRPPERHHAPAAGPRRRASPLRGAHPGRPRGSMVRARAC